MLNAARNALFDRLGGFDTLQRAVGLLVARLRAAPHLLPLLLDGAIPGNSADAEWLVQLWLTDRLGGPMSYDGPEISGVCRQLHVDQGRWGRLVGLAGEALIAAGAPPAAVDEARGVLLAALPGHDATTVPDGGASGPGTHAAVAMRQAAESVVVAAGCGDWNLFVLDADLMLIDQNEAACAALLRRDADLRRAFGLGATELLGESVLRFHPAPGQLQGLFGETERLPRDATWSFGRVAWRARVFGLPAAGPERPGFAIAWRDESEAYRRQTVITRLKAQAEELPIPVMYPDAEGDLWFGNVACEHALARLAPWLPPHLNPATGIPGALFFPDVAERRSLFTTREALPLKKRMTFGAETVSLLVSAVCDDDQQMLCPQVTWEIVHSITPAVSAPAPVVGPALPGEVTPPSGHPRPRGLTAVSSELRGEARALETSALALSSLSEVLDALADQALGETVGPPTDGLGHALESGDAAARLAEQGLAALDSAREIAAGAVRQRAVADALAQLMEIARRTNRLVVDASLSVVEDAMGDRVGLLLDRAAMVRAAVDGDAGALAMQAQDVARQLTQSVTTAGRLAELRESFGDAVPPPAVPADEAVLV